MSKTVLASDRNVSNTGQLKLFLCWFLAMGDSWRHS